jgi:hypothetical protein
MLQKYRGRPMSSDANRSEGMMQPRVSVPVSVRYAAVNFGPSFVPNLQHGLQNQPPNTGKAAFDVAG